MNNIKYYNDNLAYDFEMFMPKPSRNDKKIDNIVALPRVEKARRTRKKAAAKALSAPALLVLVFAFMLTALCGNIGIRLAINETNAEINDIKSAISELDSEKTSLEVELQRRISFTNLELEAVQLGMKKLEKDNVTYIRVNDKDVARTANGELLTAE